MSKLAFEHRLISASVVFIVLGALSVYLAMMAAESWQLPLIIGQSVAGLVFLNAGLNFLLAGFYEIENRRKRSKKKEEGKEPNGVTD